MSGVRFRDVISKRRPFKSSFRVIEELYDRMQVEVRRFDGTRDVLEVVAGVVALCCGGQRLVSSVTN
jgi:hypothetical protein